MKNPLTLAGIEPATYRFVAQHLNRCATAVTHMFRYKIKYNLSLYRCHVYNGNDSQQLVDPYKDDENYNPITQCDTLVDLTYVVPSGSDRQTDRQRDRAP